MIKIAGAARFSFLFPSDAATAYDYYSSLERLAHHLPYIDLMRVEPGGVYRMLYHSTELGAYVINMYCDVRLEQTADRKMLCVSTTDELSPVPSKSTVNATTGQGSYNAEIAFSDEGDETRIQFVLKLHGELPRPLGMKFMPRRVVDKIAKNIVNERIKEISQGFIENSIAAFPEWMETAV